MSTDNTSGGRPPESTRRQFMALGTGAVAVGAAAAVGRYVGSPRAAADPAIRLRDPFGFGVASGDPLPDAVVLWTRLAPRPLDVFGGMPYRNVPVEWQVATDDRFRHVVRHGTATARPEYTHAVHVDARGLREGTEYFYRFRAGTEISPVGRTRTAPAPSRRTDRLTFAFASCQAWHSGFYTAYEHLAAEDVDLIVHLGDYIYESGINAEGGARNVATDDRFIGEADTLDDFRNLYSIYRSDPALQAAHAAAPWIVTTDDHEVRNDYASFTNVYGIPDDDFRVRRANAYRAHWEHLPMRPSRSPEGPFYPLHRKISYGDLAEFFVLDGRQHRSPHACGDNGTRVIGCEERLDPSRTMLGFDQERWLLDGLGASRATWNVLAQQVVMTRYRQPDNAYHHDLWDGYAPARQRLLTGMVERNVGNPVVITGDNHNNIAADILLDGDDPDSPIVASEFLGTSISSSGDGADQTDFGETLLELNPQMAFTNYQRGYVRCTVDRATWRTDYRVVPYVTRPGAPVSTRASFVVEDGRPGLQPA